MTSMSPGWTPSSASGAQEHVLGLLDAEALAHLGLEEGADAGLEEDVAAAVLADEHAATGEADAVVVVGRGPAGPHVAGTVAEHRAAVQALGVAVDREDLHRGLR
jgi:hypothetical protein